MREKLSALPLEVEVDEAGNQWATLPGDSERAVLIGGHIDSGPNGGWLDGCLNVVAGLEVLRRIAAEGRPPGTVRLVAWAGEEGARFGRRLLRPRPAPRAPVPGRRGPPLGVARGTVGVERHVVRFTGQSAHAGSTPMEDRRDAFAAAARLALEVREIAKRGQGVGTGWGVGAK